MDHARKLLLGQPGDEDGPVFDKAWQAQAFATTVMLHNRGVFTWSEWTTGLSQEIKSAQASGDPDLGDSYYDHWVNALERILVDKRITKPGQLSDLTDAWQEAARNTPHGQPIELVRPT